MTLADRHAVGKWLLIIGWFVLPIAGLDTFNLSLILLCMVTGIYLDYPRRR